MGNFRMPVLIMAITSMSWLHAQRDLRVSFDVRMDSSWEWSGHGSIGIKTDDDRENRRFGRYTESIAISRVALHRIKAKLQYEKFHGRSVSISFTGNPEDCLYMPTLSGHILTDGSLTTLMIHRDQDCWNNRTTEAYGGTFLKRRTFATGTDTIGTIPVPSKFSVRVLDMDLPDSARVSFAVDTTCKVIDRKVIQGFRHIRDDVPDDVFENIERALRRNFNTCIANPIVVLPIRYLVD